MPGKVLSGSHVRADNLEAFGALGIWIRAQGFRALENGRDGSIRADVVVRIYDSAVIKPAVRAG